LSITDLITGVKKMARKIILPAERENTECTLYAKHFAVSCEKQEGF